MWIAFHSVPSGVSVILMSWASTVCMSIDFLGFWDSSVPLNYAYNILEFLYPVAVISSTLLFQSVSKA